MIIGYFDFAVIGILMLINILILRKRINSNIGCLLVGLIFGLVLPIVSQEIEIDKVSNEREILDNFTLLYTFLKFPFYWIVGAVQIAIISKRVRKIQIDGKKISTLEEFYDEIERQFTKGLDWEMGRNLNAFNDILYGGFGVHSYQEKIEIHWVNSERSKFILGFEETIKYLQIKLKECHATNKQNVKNDLDLAQNRVGKTLFEILIEIIKEHEHIKLRIK